MEDATIENVAPNAPALNRKLGRPKNLAKLTNQLNLQGSNTGPKDIEAIAHFLVSASNHSWPSLAEMHRHFLYERCLTHSNDWEGADTERVPSQNGYVCYSTFRYYVKKLSNGMNLKFANTAVRERLRAITWKTAGDRRR